MNADAPLGWIGVCSILSLLAATGWWKWSREVRASDSSSAIEAQSDEVKDPTVHRPLRSTLRLSLTEDIAGLFAQSNCLEDALREIVDLVHGVTGARSVAIFCLREGRLRPVAHKSPSEKLGSKFDILELGESTIQDVWPDKSVVGPGLSEEGRYFPGEEQSLAYRLSQVGVLYLGHREKDGFTADVMQMMPTLVSQICLGVDTVSAREREVSALRAKAQALAKLQDWNERSEILHQRANELGAVLEFEPLLEGLFALLKRLFPDQRVSLSVRGQHRCEPAHQDLFEEPRDEVLKWARSLLVREEAQSKYPSLKEAQSLLGVPVLHGSSTVGALLVSSLQKNAFDDVDLQLLKSLAEICHSALERSRLHLSTVEAMQKLQDSEAQLVQSSKLAAVGVLAAGIAHELNTPLGTVRLGLEFVGKNLTKKPERTKTMIELAKTGLDKSQDIVNKLLHYCREGNLDHQFFSLKEVVDDAVSFLKHHMEQDGVELQAVVASDLEVFGNKNELQQVLSNLVMNARDAMMSNEGERKITINSSVAGDSILIDVADSGPGVTDEVAEKMFDPFYTTKSVGEGTGLGLSICQQILNKHEGNIELLRASPGATFRITIPRASSRT